MSNKLDLFAVPQLKKKFVMTSMEFMLFYLFSFLTSVIRMIFISSQIRRKKTFGHIYINQIKVGASPAALANKRIHMHVVKMTKNIGIGRTP